MERLVYYDCDFEWRKNPKYLTYSTSDDDLGCTILPVVFHSGNKSVLEKLLARIVSEEKQCA